MFRIKYITLQPLVTITSERGSSISFHYWFGRLILLLYPVFCYECHMNSAGFAASLFVRFSNHIGKSPLISPVGRYCWVMILDRLTVGCPVAGQECVVRISQFRCDCANASLLCSASPGAPCGQGRSFIIRKNNLSNPVLLGVQWAVKI